MPSSPAASSSAASHKESTVPTSCAKHSDHVLSGFGLPSITVLGLASAQTAPLRGDGLQDHIRVF